MLEKKSDLQKSDKDEKTKQISASKELDLEILSSKSCVNEYADDSDEEKRDKIVISDGEDLDHNGNHGSDEDVEKEMLQPDERVANNCKNCEYFASG